jgi:hypothetical protein
MYKYLYFLLYAVISFPCFTQEYNRETNEFEVPPLLLHTEGFFAKTYYQRQDGTPVEYKNVMALIKSIPENESLVQSERAWRIATYITAGLFAASFVTASVYTIWELPESDVILPVSLYTGASSFLVNVLTGKIAQIKLQCAVDRYNLRVMGILAF